MARGKFIVLDGGEGAGKTTVLAELKTALGPKTLLTREVGGTSFAEEMRAFVYEDRYRNLSPESFFALVWAARADHVKTKIEPALAQGRHVISDRFDSSTYALQLYGQQALHLETLFWQTREVFLGKTVPDRYIFLDVEHSIGLSRIPNREGALSHFDRSDVAFYSRVQEGFKKFFERVSHSVIDAGRPLEEVKREFMAIVEAVIK
ncbi:MAG TPA: dTMP kinase [Candidatus Paceibacterota bacterium]